MSTSVTTIDSTGSNTNTTPMGTAAGQASGAFDAAGAASAAQAASQPLDSDLTAIAALATTDFGRAFLTMANAGAVLTALGTVAITTDTGWTANNTAGDKTAALSSYSNGVNSTMISALNVVSSGTGTAIGAAFDILVIVVKKLAALETALAVKTLPNA